MVVEGEVSDVNLAGALEYSWRDPGNITIVTKQGLCFVIYLEISNCTVEREKDRKSKTAKEEDRGNVKDN